MFFNCIVLLVWGSAVLNEDVQIATTSIDEATIVAASSVISASTTGILRYYY